MLLAFVMTREYPLCMPVLAMAPNIDEASLDLSKIIFSEKSLSVHVPSYPVPSEKNVTETKKFA